MPIYEYACKKCESTQEIFHGMTEDPEIVCDKCGGKTRRIISSGISYTMKGKTRNSTWKQRHGHKKGSQSATPSESAEIKANEIINQEAHRVAKETNPYAGTY